MNAPAAASESMPPRDPEHRAFAAVSLSMRLVAGNMKAIAGPEVLRFFAASQPQIAGDHQRIDCKRVAVRIQDGAGIPTPFDYFVKAIGERIGLELFE